MKQLWSIPALLLAGTMPAIGWPDMTGKEVFDRHCVHCHGTDIDAAGTRQLARTRGEDKALLTERDDLTAEYVEFVVRHGLKSMPAFVPSDLTEARLKVLTDYLTR